MLFDLNGNTYQVKFYRGKPATAAALLIKDGDKFQFVNLIGESRCNPKDKFEKSKGRKIALAKLLSKIYLVAGPVTKEDRTKIWEIYFKEHKK